MELKRAPLPPKCDEFKVGFSDGGASQGDDPSPVIAPITASSI